MSGPQWMCQENQKQTNKNEIALYVAKDCEI